jgi:hypothetical protein
MEGLPFTAGRFVARGRVCGPRRVINPDVTGIRRREKDDLAGAATRGHPASLALAVKLHWVLRVGVALEFLGHGLAGFYRPVAWISVPSSVEAPI